MGLGLGNILWWTDGKAVAAAVSTAPTARIETTFASVSRGVKSTESISKTEKTTEGFSRP